MALGGIFCGGGKGDEVIKDGSDGGDGSEAAAVDFTRADEDLPTVDYGSVERFTACMYGDSIPFVIDMWLPGGYSPASLYPVVYMADGQNVFDKDQSFAGVAWEVEQKITQLARDGSITQPAIVVAISNRGAHNLRERDYFPEKALANISSDEWGDTYLPADFRLTCRGDEYAAFVAGDVKPFIDSHYSTMPEREHTFTMGSSMGSLIALYIMCEYPGTVGGAACMSTHWVGSISATADNGYTMLDDKICAAAMLKYFGDNLPADGTDRLHLDEGDTGWDALYVAYNKQMAEMAEAKGYSTAAATLMVNYWTGSGHNEWFWQQHCAVPLEFMLGKTVSGIDAPTAPATATSTMIYTLQGCPVGEAPEALSPGFYCRKGEKFHKR